MSSPNDVLIIGRRSPTNATDEESIASRQWFVLWVSFLSGGSPRGPATITFLPDRAGHSHVFCRPDISEQEQSDVLTMVHAQFSNNPRFTMQVQSEIGIGPTGWTLEARRILPGIQHWSIECRDDAPRDGWDIRPLIRKVLNLFDESVRARPEFQELFDRLDLVV